MLLATQAQLAAKKWEESGLETRLRILQEAGSLLAKNKNKIYEAFYSENLSKTLAKDYAEWIVHAADPNLLKAYAHKMVQWVTSNDSGGELLIRRADGVVLLFAQAGSPTFNVATLFSLLLPGNAVIVVRSPFINQGPKLIIEEILQPVLENNGFSKEVVSLVTEKYREVLKDLMSAKEVKTVLSIGNSQDNSNIAKECSIYGKKVILEHYGRGCLVVWKDAEIDSSIKSALRAFDFSTKPCFLPKHIFVHENIFDKFLEDFIKSLPKYSKTVTADPEEGVLVPVALLNIYEANLKEASHVGQIKYGGYRMDAYGQKDDNGDYVPPTIVSLDSQICLEQSLKCIDEEIFFPLIPIVKFSGTDNTICEDMLKLINRPPVGLRTSIWTKSSSIINYFTKYITNISLLRFNNDHSQSPSYASFWGGGNGDNHLFWEKASHLQAIDCQQLQTQQINSILETLGCLSLIQSNKQIPANLTTGILRTSNISDKVISNVNAQTQAITLKIEETIAIIEFSRADKHNAINRETKDLLEQITLELTVIAQQLRCVVIQGLGKSFCSGADLKELTTISSKEAKEFMVSVTGSFRRLEQLPIPVIAAVKGYCMGGGFELALHCDEIIAAEDTLFRFPETSIGITTTTGAVSRLIATIGTIRAKSMLTGKIIKANEALQIGLVTQVVPNTELSAIVNKRCHELLAQPANSLAAMKRIITKCQNNDNTISWITELEAFEELSQYPWQKLVFERLKKDS